MLKKRTGDGMEWHGMTCESRSKQAGDEEMELDLSWPVRTPARFTMKSKWKGHVGRQLLMLQVLPPLLHFAFARCLIVHKKMEKQNLHFLPRKLASPLPHHLTHAWPSLIASNLVK